MSFSQVEKGHFVAIVSLAPSEKDFQGVLDELAAVGVRIYTPDKLKRKLGRVLWLRNVIDAVNPDVVLGHSFLPSIYARFACRTLVLRSKPLVIDVLHAITRTKSLVNLLLQHAFPPDATVAVSNSTLDSFRKFFPVRHPTVIPNGIKLERFSSSGDIRRFCRQEIYGASQSTIVFLQTGRLCELKGQHLTIRAFERLISINDIDAKLFLVGPAEDQQYVESIKLAIKNSGLAQRIFLLGPRPDIPRLLAGADVFLMPSAREAHSIALLEALASGIEVIASNIDAFSLFRSYKGLSLVSVEDVEPYAYAMKIAVERNRRYQHDLHSFSIETTVNLYESLILDLKKQP